MYLPGRWHDGRPSSPTETRRVGVSGLDGGSVDRAARGESSVSSPPYTKQRRAVRYTKSIYLTWSKKAAWRSEALLGHTMVDERKQQRSAILYSTSYLL